MRVVNDTAERAVKLVSDFSQAETLLTRDEDQLQFVLQVVEGHRIDFPDMRKGTIVSGLLAS